MIRVTDGLTLYHGSYCEISNPKLEKCAKRKDFGKGFYLTSSKEQAISFLKISIAKAVSAGDISDNQNFGYVSEFKFSLNDALRIKIFEEADNEWLHCIAAHRKRKTFPEIEEEMKQYDIVVGKIADDATNATLVSYIASAFGKVGSKEADDLCINQLLPEKLKDQFCFRSDLALEHLKFVKGEKIWLKK